MSVVCPCSFFLRLFNPKQLLAALLDGFAAPGAAAMFGSTASIAVICTATGFSDRPKIIRVLMFRILVWHGLFLDGISAMQNVLSSQLVI